MSDPIWLALIVGAFGLLTTYLTLTAPARMAKLNNAAVAAALKVKDDRDDARAASLKRDTEAVRLQAIDTARLLSENGIAVAAQAKRTDSKLQDMHVLINSLYTAAKEGELRAVELALATMRVLNRQGPTPEIAAQIETTEADRNRLRSELEERAAAAKFAAERREV